MLRSTRSQLNFYPLGRRAGPQNYYEKKGVQNNLVSRTWFKPHPKKMPHLERHRIKLDCPLCSFCWDWDTLTVKCPAVESHNKREMWQDTHWMWKEHQVFRYYKHMPTTLNFRTGERLADAFSRSNNNERRGQGLTSKVRMLTKENWGMASHVSGIGHRSAKWETHFPYPS